MEFFKHSGDPFGWWRIRTEAISDQPNSLKTLILDLKRRAMEAHAETGLEHGAFVAQYSDGSGEVLRFTSFEQAMIKDEDILGPLNAVLERVQGIRTLIHLHTHPNADGLVKTSGSEAIDLSFSNRDLKSYRTISNMLDRKVGRHIDFQAIVAPLGNHFEDLLFSTQI